ncbi:zinc transporter ZIP9 [Oryzias latipes]|uniref:zinc transporter ZIP9 n=1 Tax=Oryzias latipes TaxID=8090 RepID=UPI0005CBDE35|nr:zinc transporter ZIP9 [Oryzias latipes]
MDGGLTITFFSVAMFVGSFLLGFFPLLFRLSEKSLQFVSILGAGLLCGTALAITIPEGVALLEDSWKASSSDVPSALNANKSNASATEEESPPPRSYIGVALTLGFTFMFVVDQVGGYFSTRGPSRPAPHGSHITATLGLVIHAAADGFALGAAVATGQVAVQVVVFFAVILHKAPAAFGLVSFLMHAGLDKKFIQGHLLAFSAAAPLVAISTYFILQASGNSAQKQLGATGVGMLFSAGTFLYVATVHVLPEVSRTEQRPSQLQQHAGAGDRHQRHLGLMESATLILGVGLPVLLALGLHDD